MSGDSTDDDLDDGAGRGMLGVSLGDDGLVVMEHQETDKKFEFKLDDLEEVIDTLDEFRVFIRAREAESNGEA